MTSKSVITSIFSLPLVAVEITPLISSRFCLSDESITEKYNSLISPELAKFQLKKISIQSTMKIGLEIPEVMCNNNKVKTSFLQNFPLNNSLQSGTIMIQRYSNSNQYHIMKGKETIFIVLIYSDDPSIYEPIPCYVRGYVKLINANESHFVSPVVITKGTHVRVCNPKQIQTDTKNILSHHFSNAYIVKSFYYNHAGSNNKTSFKDKNDISVLSNHDPDTIKSLALRMKLLLKTKYFISTSYDAIDQQKRESNHKSNIKLTIKSFHQNRRHRQMKNDIFNQQNYDQQINQKSIYQKDNKQNTKSSSLSRTDQLFSSGYTSPILQEGGFTIYNSYNSSGKTTLLLSIARHMLNCSNIHVLNPGLLFAKYGVTYADTALEGIIYDLVLGCALNTDNRICIILDGLDGFVGMQNGNQNKNDPSFVTYNAIAAYLSNLSSTLRTKQKFPYPSKNNLLYTLTQTAGYLLPVHICLIGVVTFPFNIKTTNISVSSTLNLLGGRFYLSNPSASTRCHAFHRALLDVGINITNQSKDTQAELEHLAVSCIHARGIFFSIVIEKLRKIIKRDNNANNITKKQLHEAFSTSTSSSNETNFILTSKQIENTFNYTSTVGGNTEAKAALENAIALNPILRKAFAKFHLSPPTGVLLYGPPGTGKTLLARATAESLQQQCQLKNQPNISGKLRGLFITLHASQVVRSEVGNSEKIVVSAFQMARTNTPSVIFIDEFQALFTERGKGSGRLATTLLQCMDDVAIWRDADKQVSKTQHDFEATEDLSNRVVVLGATNAPWMIDNAFLRPGRFDRVVHVGLPTFDERKTILKIHLSRMKIFPSNVAAKEKIILAMAAVCKEFSGADLEALCRAAAVRCLRESEGINSSAERKELFVEDKHFQQARLNDVHNSSDALLVQKLKEWKQ